MARGKNQTTINLPEALLQAFATNERINQFLLENLDDNHWSAEPPSGEGRTVGAIVAHLHNVRHMWLMVSGKGKGIPPKLDRSSCTRKQAMVALKKSHRALEQVLKDSLSSGGQIKDFRPDVASFVGYLIAHDAHHRGQICQLVRQMGHRLPMEVSFGMWDWGKRWKECGFEK